MYLSQEQVTNETRSYIREGNQSEFKSNDMISVSCGLILCLYFCLPFDSERENSLCVCLLFPPHDLTSLLFLSSSPSFILFLHYFLSLHRKESTLCFSPDSFLLTSSPQNVYDVANNEDKDEDDHELGKRQEGEEAFAGAASSAAHNISLSFSLPFPLLMLVVCK